MIEPTEQETIYYAEHKGAIHTEWKYWKFYIDNNGFGKVYTIPGDRDIGLEEDAEKAYRRLNGKMRWLWNTKLGRLLVLV